MFFCILKNEDEETSREKVYLESFDPMSSNPIEKSYKC
jgi:hypothetical protein